jgi:major type 1 subunit fimbrin (pilin)
MRSLRMRSRADWGVRVDKSTREQTVNKTILSLALGAGLGIVAAPQAASATDGTLYFHGTIEESTCIVTGGAGTDGGVGNVNVTLPTIEKSALPDGSRAGDTPFELILGGDSTCTNGKVAKLWFETAQSPLINPTTGNLKNSGGATNVEVGLLNDSKAAINLYTNSNPSKATIVGNTGTLKYWAQYVATGGDAGAGSVETSVVYSVAYN